MVHRRFPVPHHVIGATAICFNDHSSMPNPFTEDLLVDAGIFVAHFDANDPWHDAVEDFFNTYVYSSTYTPKFYTTYDIINEYLHRIAENYKNRTGTIADPTQRKIYAQNILELIKNQSVELIDTNNQTIIDSINRWANSTSYGSKDAFHVSNMLDWHIELITVDHKLMYALESDPDFSGRKVYYPSISMRK